MIDGCAQIFQLAASGCLSDRPRWAIGFSRLARFPRLASAPFNIVAAKLAVDVGQHVGLPEIGERQNPLFRFIPAGMVWRNLVQIEI
jgi:hypothetical protein